MGNHCGDLAINSGIAEGVEMIVSADHPMNEQQIVENAREFMSTIMKLKPATAKGTYVKSVYLSSTMSKGVKVDTKSIDEN